MHSENTEVKPSKRKVTPIERFFTRSPFSIVTMIARIEGTITEGMLVSAVGKVQQRHLNLRVRIQDDQEHTPWFTTEGVGAIPIQIVTRKSDEEWIKVHHEASKVAFDFEQHPAIRFILVQSMDRSELIILCHHIICDGLSLAFLTRDLMLHLGDQHRDVEVLPGPVPINLENMPDDVSINPIARFFINRINRKWEADKIFFDQEDYENIRQAYWGHFNHKTIPVELSERQTTALVEKSRSEGVTVNAALATAFLGAQIAVQDARPYHDDIGVAASLRDRLPKPPGERMGFFAGVVNLKYRYDQRADFWENTRRLHRKLKPRYTNKTLFKEFASWCYLEPTFIESINFKKLGGLVPADASRHEKLSAFSTKEDVVLSMLKRDKMESPEQTVFGTAITNLGRMDFPRAYGALTLDRLIMNPGGAIPLAGVNLVVGAVTCAGKLSLLLEYEGGRVQPGTMETIRDQAMVLLLGDGWKKV